MSRGWAIVVGGERPAGVWNILLKALGEGYCIDDGLLLEAPPPDAAEQILHALEARASAPAEQRVWVHIAGILRQRRGKPVLELQPGARNVLQLDELAYVLRDIPSAQRILLLEMKERPESSALAGLRQLAWPPLTFGAAGHGIADSLERAFTAGAAGRRTAGDLNGLECTFACDADAVVGIVAAGRPTIDVAAMEDVHRYLEALERQTNHVPSVDLRDGEGAQPRIQEIYVEPNVVDAHSPGNSRRKRRTRQQDAEPETMTLHEAVAKHPFLFLEGAPGSGKSTFLRRLAWEMCRHIRLHEPLPAGLPEAPFPVLVALQDYAGQLGGQPPSAAHLLDFAYGRLMLAKGSGRDVLARDTVEARMRAGGVLLLDGLDEVPGRVRRSQVAEVITELAQIEGDLRIVVTCRPAAAKADARPGAPFVSHTIARFSDDQRLECATRWLLRRTEDEDEARSQALRLMAELKLHPHVDDHARTPLVLNMVGLLFYEAGQLPRQRWELYQQLIRRLVTDRNRAWTGPAKGLEPIDRIGALKAIAWRWRSASQHDDESGALLLETACAEAIRDELQVDRPTALDLITFLELRTGLLEWRSTWKDERQLAFAHRTFAEYLIAGRLAAEEAQPPAVLMENAADADWREIALLYVGLILNGTNRPSEPAETFIERLAAQAERDAATSPAVRAAKARLAAECLSEHRDRVRRKTVAQVDALQAVFRNPEINERFPAEDRVGFWNAIGAHSTALHDPAQRWIEVPAGRYWCGASPADDDARNNERPGHWLQHEGFYVQRWPVLVMEMARFVEAGGYRAPRWWPDGGKWVTEQGINEPAEWTMQCYRPSHPVVGVSWLEAMAYARWLNAGENALIRPPDGLELHLPSEAQWEAAARGRRFDEDGAQWRYPWSDDFDENRARIEGGTSPVGAFAVGPDERAWDLSGNVDEWCLDAYDDEAYAGFEAKDGTANASCRMGSGQLGDPEARRVVRGGSFDGDPSWLRVSYRGWFGASGRDDLLGFRVVASSLPRTLGL